jgi:hypothetical protein
VAQNLVDLTYASYRQFVELVGFEEAKDMVQTFKFLAAAAGSFEGLGNEVDAIEGNCIMQVILRTYDIADEYKVPTKVAAEVLMTEMQEARAQAARS